MVSSRVILGSTGRWTRLRAAVTATISRSNVMGASRFAAMLSFVAGCTLLSAGGVAAQEPAAWGDTPHFHTFSIAAIDPATGESGVAVTTS